MAIASCPNNEKFVPVTWTTQQLPGCGMYCTYVHVDLVPQDDDATSVLSGSGGAADEQDEDGTYIACRTLHCMLQLVLHLVSLCVVCVCVCVHMYLCFCVCVSLCACSSLCCT